MFPRISMLSQEDLAKVAALADELGLVLKASALSREAKLKRFFVDGRKCRIRHGEKVWEGVIYDYNPHFAANWFYVKCDLSVYWQWKIPRYIEKPSQIYTETDPYSQNNKFWHDLSREEQVEIVKGRRMWSIEFDEWLDRIVVDAEKFRPTSYSGIPFEFANNEKI